MSDSINQLPNNDNTDPGGAVIQLESLSKEYPMGDTTVHALDHISLRVSAGEYVAIMGTSGSGKSTLLNILGCLDTPSTGTYLLEGLDVGCMRDANLSALRRERFGFVFQSFNLIPQITVLENIEVPLFYQGRHERESRQRARELADLVGLGDRVRHRPTELSGGQRQRVAIARALANDPSVILADEPTGNLDSRTGREIMAVLDDLAHQGRTIILVTHEAHIAEHAHRTIQLRDGQIALDTKSPEDKA